MPAACGDVVDADLVEAAGGEEVDGDIAEVVPGRGAPPANRGARNPAASPPRPSISALDAIFLRSRSQLSRPNDDERCEPWSPECSRPSGGDIRHELVTETLVEEVSIDGMCGVY